MVTLADGYARLVAGDRARARDLFTDAASGDARLGFLSAYAGSPVDDLEAVASSPVRGDPWWLGTLAVGVSSGITEEPRQVAAACSALTPQRSDHTLGELLATSVPGNRSD